jgi:hypothetical protein
MSSKFEFKEYINQCIDSHMGYYSSDRNVIEKNTNNNDINDGYTNNYTNKYDDFLNNNDDHKITISNFNNSNIYFDCILNYFSSQLYYIETNQTEKYDKNIVDISCFTYDNINDTTYDNINNTYDVSVITPYENGYITKKTMTNMNIVLKYKVESINSINNILQYKIQTHCVKPDIYIKPNININNCITLDFFPSNKRSLRFFDEFVTSIIKSNRTF